jgi:hypothetical protein
MTTADDAFTPWQISYELRAESTRLQNLRLCILETQRLSGGQLAEGKKPTWSRRHWGPRSTARVQYPADATDAPPDGTNSQAHTWTSKGIHSAEWVHLRSLSCPTTQARLAETNRFLASSFTLHSARSAASTLLGGVTRLDWYKYITCVQIVLVHHQLWYQHIDHSSQLYQPTRTATRSRQVLHEPTHHTIPPPGKFNNTSRKP